MRLKKYIKTLGYIAAIFLFLGTVPSLYFFDKYNSEFSRQIERSQTEGLRQLAYSKRELGSVVGQIRSTVQLLGHGSILHQFIINNENKVNQQQVEELWSAVAINQQIFSQLRFLDTSGQEKVRINYFPKTRSAIPAKKLQNKAGRDYFKYAKSLPAEVIGSFGVDLEREHGQVIKPYTPALRVITPVEFGGKRHGYLIANLDVWFMSSILNFSPSLELIPEFVDSNGYYIVGHDQSKTFGHLIQGRGEFNLPATHPELWSEMISNRVGSYYDGDSLYAYQALYLTKDKGRAPLYLLISIDQRYLQAEAKLLLKTVIQQASIVLLVLLLVAIPCGLMIMQMKKSSLESQLAKAALEGMSAVVITDKHNRIIRVNDEFSRISGYSAREVMGKSPSMLASGKHNQEFYLKMWSALKAEGVWEGEVENRRKDGSLLTEILRIQAVKNSRQQIQYYIASFVDISERKQLEQRLRYLSEKDSLTDCWNRRKFDAELKDQAQLTRRYPETHCCCLAILDIDYFKRINDQRGHDVGDRVIRHVASILKSGCRDTDFVARTGGEEFAILMPHTTTVEAEVVLNRLRVAVSSYSEFEVTISGGVTDIKEQAEEAYKRADIALYDSKSGGRNRISICYSHDDIA